MDVQKYLEGLLNKSSDYVLTEEEKSKSEKGLAEYVYSKLTSKKFRKWKMDPDCEERTRNAIKIQLEKNEPIKVIYFQGGYKLWRFPSSPEADWAEFFNISYLINYLAPIANVYDKGVELTYYCHTLLMEKHDNLSTEEIKKYMDSFQFLIDEFSKFLPKNFTIKILRDADIYSRDEYFKALEDGRKMAEEQIKQWSEEKIKDHRRMSQLNIKWKGKEDWTKFSEKEKEEKLHLASVYEVAATSNLPKVMKAVKAPNLVLLFTKPSTIFIGIGSTYTSVAKHWIGFGVLEKHKDSFIPRILSPSQFETVKKEKNKTIEINLFPNYKNLKEIILLDNHLNH